MYKIKLLLFTFCLSIGGALSAQTIQSVSPDHGFHGQTLGVTISGQNTHFMQGTATGNISNLTFAQGTHTLNVIGSSALSNTAVNVQLGIPGTAGTGDYDLYMYSFVDGALTLPGAFTVNALSGQLTGTIFGNGGGQRSGDSPMPNLALKLTGMGINMNTTTDASGNFAFGNLDYGTYQLHLNESGYDNSSAPAFSINYQNQSYNQMIFRIEGNQLVYEGILGFDGAGVAENHWKIYPNPAAEYVNVSFYADGKNDVEAILYDISGRHIADWANSQSIDGLNKLHLDLAPHQLKPGSYLLLVRKGNEQHVLELMIR